MSKHFKWQLLSFSTTLLTITAGLTFGLNAHAQTAATTYPTRPIKLIAPVAAGGGLDNLARKVAERLSKNLGQTIIIENMGGGGGTIASQYVAKAAPDGYTLLVSYVPLMELTLQFASYPTMPSKTSLRLE